jgi:hypothetical protein
MNGKNSGNRFSKTPQNYNRFSKVPKSLVLRCMPFMEKGVGSAWGLPVIAAGKERFSALALSGKLEPPGSLLANGDPLRAERLSELETLGIGPLGRYLGGEPIKPVPLSPEDFFTASLAKARSKNERRDERRKSVKASELFCSGLEFDDTRWVNQGNTAELFRGHLEFLRCWGFSGGLSMEDAALPSLLAGYIKHLQKETAREKSKIIVLVSKYFFEARLAAELPNAKPSGDLSAGEIPVNVNSEGGTVWGPDFAGLGIALYEDIAPMLRSQKIRCDILLIVITKAEQPAQDVSAGTIAARLKLYVTAAARTKQKNKTGVDEKKELSLNGFLYRDLAKNITDKYKFPLKHSCSFAPFVDKYSSYFQNSVSFGNSLSLRCRARPRFGHEEAEAFGLLPQWEAGRVETSGGCVFAVNAKFSGLRAADFKEEQAQFYREAPGKKGESQNWNPPPVRYGAAFSGLNEIQLDFFLRWRGECRRGFIPLCNSGGTFIESYILLYANELILCMGREGPLQHFTALLCLFHACGEHFPETAALLLHWLADFAVVYCIATDALPLLLDELKNNGWFNKVHSESEKTAMLIDLALYHFFVEKAENIGEGKFWPFIRTLIPPRILARKENDAEFPVQCCRTLAALDTQLRRDWNRGFFSIFCPPVQQRNDYAAFENGRGMGESSYTVYRPGFSSHKPLIGILSALALEPGINPLPGVKARLHPLSLENELLEELRQESDAVRELLKSDEYDQAAHNHGVSRGNKLLNRPETPCSSVVENYRLTDNAYTPPDKTALLEFIDSLGETERNALKSITQRMKDRPALPGSGSVPDGTIDAINAAFYERFKDILIETGSTEPSISAEYEAILGAWE